ncbi:nuclear transport factor 2 family protein [Seohaeicola zhoushanensis]|uniref:SnoaL-like domain-containing protein n=1 Tax=Seohaeicola zhoushanensis TaxID=1569283 RepID=A0A8J3H3S9_9RHOB|nr:nuclear transport factor 2 family protein [Seohaeicola zhoushanensis]GHF73351.1 hypothetical protein GCM10017056_50200 [Seohaeicola zhoushanensis]
MTGPLEVAQGYIALWNTTDAATRRAVLGRLWTPDARYRDPMMQGRGLDEIDAMIAAMQAKYMPALEFTLVSTPDGHGPYVRFSWGLGPAGAGPVAIGTDVVRLEDGRIAEVTGFLDLVPAAA